MILYSSSDDERCWRVIGDDALRADGDRRAGIDDDVLASFIGLSDQVNDVFASRKF
jgi:hypothetical protein